MVGMLMVGILISYPAFSQSANIPDREVINSDLLSEKMKIFPNPSDGRFQIRLEYVGKEKITAKVFDITGKLILDISEDLVVGDSSISADVELKATRTGIYFLRIEIGISTFTKKIIIR